MSSVDSGPSLVDEFKDQSSKASLLGDSCSRVLLDVDEMKDLFEKSKVTAGNRNSLSTELLKLFETNITGNRARSSKRGKIEVTNAHLAILGGATTRGYEMMWTGTGGGATGLQSRFTLVTTSAPRMPIQKAPTDMVKVVEVLERIRSQAERPEQVISLTSEALKVLADWWARTSRDRESESRVDDAVKRLLIVLAATNDINTIGPGMVQQACQFGDYLIACREKFNPADSHSWTQAFENAILKVAVARNVAMTRNEFRQRVNPTQKAGGLGPFIQAWNNVVTSGMLKQDGATQKGTAKYRARPEKTVVK
jgi:hypothetical protein